MSAPLPSSSPLLFKFCFAIKWDDPQILISSSLTKFANLLSNLRFEKHANVRSKSCGDNHLLQIDVMKKVAAVRVVQDCCHGEPGMQSNQGDELKRQNKVMNSLGMGVALSDMPNSNRFDIL